jgi:succinoglycan biosynthesis transport protein ExoP
MELRDLLATAGKRRGVVILVLILTTGLGAVFALSQPKKYESVATIAFTPDVAEGQGFLPSDALEALVLTYGETAKSRVILNRAEARAGGPLPGEVDTATEEGAGILRIIGEDTSPQGAAATARAVAQAFLASIQENQLLVGRVVDPAVAPTSPVQPRPPLIIAVSALLGLAAGFMLAYALEHFRRRIESADDVAEFTPAPVIGRLPRARPLQRGTASLIWDSEKLGALQEGYRALRTNIEFLTKGESAAIQVTSPNAAQGKSTIVANLGIAFAQVGIETLVLDADLRRPYQHQIFGVANDRGLSTMMAVPDATAEPVPTGVPGLWLLPSGPIPPNSTEMLHIRFERVLADLRSRYSLVLVDSPPILPVSDARLIAPRADGVMLVLSAGTQKPAALRSALEKLALAGAEVLGVVLNQAGHDMDAVEAYDAYRYEDRPAAVPRERPVSLR